MLPILIPGCNLHRPPGIVLPEAARTGGALSSRSSQITGGRNGGVVDEWKSIWQKP